MADDDLRPELKHTARTALRQANPDSFGRTGGNPEVVQHVAGIERRASEIKERLRAHSRRFEENWTTREAVGLWQKRVHEAARHPKPEGAERPELEPEALMRDARRNVRARATRRLSNLNAIKTGMQNAVIRTQQSMKQERGPEISRNPERARTMRRTQ